MAGVRFRLSGRAAGLGFAPPAGETASFVRGDITLALEIELSGTGHETSDCLIDARTLRTLSGSAYAEFENRWTEIRNAAPVAKPSGSPGGLVLSATALFWQDAPELAAGICRDIHTELRGEAVRLVQLLRWLGNRPWPAHFASGELRWSLDGETWHEGPTVDEEFVPLGGPELELDVGVFERILASEELAEPVARQILLEAVSAAEGGNPRAGYILAFAAAEIGIKQFAVEGGEGTSEAWLIENLQSPRMDRLLKGYLPRLTDKRTSDGRTAVPRPLTKALADAMEKRNELMHTSEPAPDDPAVTQLLVAVNDLLYLLDWFGGHEWAFDHLTEETRAAYSAGVP